MKKRLAKKPAWVKVPKEQDYCWAVTPKGGKVAMTDRNGQALVFTGRARAREIARLRRGSVRKIIMQIKD